MDARITALLRSGRTRWIIYGLAALFLALIIFQLGVYTGYHKASFAYGMGQQYYRVFEGPGGNRGPHGFLDAHGAAGRIISISLPTFVVKGPDDVEKIVLIGDDTEIRKFRETASTTDLASDDFVVVIGEPNTDAQIRAKLIRIMPAPADSSEE